MKQFLSQKLQELRSTVEEVVQQSIAPHAAQVDKEYLYPKHSLDALGAAGLMGLNVPRRLGGHEQGLTALVIAAETIGKACPSSAMCFAMHCVGTAVIAAKPTRYQEDNYLRPIAEGKHVTTLSLSEPGTGAHFYLPSTKLVRENDDFFVTGTKQFVTNGGQADSYVVSTATSGVGFEAGDFSCLLVDNNLEGVNWLELWRGFGMHGNSSRGLKLDNVKVSKANLLGEEGDQVWYAFEVVAPYFMMAMAGTYLGIAMSALDYTLHHLRTRMHEHSGETLSQIPILQHKITELWIAVEKTRLLIYHAAQMGDLGDSQALISILASKADVADTVVWVVNEAMTLCGGIAYRENDQLTRMLRDARASHVMSPTTDMLKTWAGRSLLGLPLL
jgi:alkylation response protein AidB-like acyl-CoA dehydrogenase